MKGYVKNLLLKFLKFSVICKLIIKIYPLATEIYYLGTYRSTHSQNTWITRYRNLQNLLEISHLSPSNYKRYGNSQDGGYYLVDIVNSNCKLLSLGIGSDVTFEAELGKIVKEVHLYDHTVDGLPQDVQNSFFFQKKISSVDFQNEISLNTCFTNLDDQSGQTLLKVDIEGDELTIFDTLNENFLFKTSQIVIEIHNLKFLMKDTYYSKLVNLLVTLSKFHTPVYINANNWDSYDLILNKPLPNTLEITYLHNNVKANYKFYPRFASPTEYPNTNLKPSIEMSFLI